MSNSMERLVERCHVDKGTYANVITADVRALIKRVSELEDQLHERTVSSAKKILKLQEKLDPEVLAEAIAAWDVEYNGDAMYWTFGGEGDNGEMLIEALRWALEENS